MDVVVLVFIGIRGYMHTIYCATEVAFLYLLSFCILHCLESNSVGNCHFHCLVILFPPINSVVFVDVRSPPPPPRLYIGSMRVGC